MSGRANPGRNCAHCLTSPAMPDNALCEPCSLLPRCEVCEVFFDGLVSASQQNPNRCDDCLNFEERIKFLCHICSTPIPLYISRTSNVLHYIIRGNGCGTCNAAARTASREGREDEEDSQFVGYLAILEPVYRAGVITQEAWELAIRRNRHDVRIWDGLDESLREEEVDLEVIETEA